MGWIEKLNVPRINKKTLLFVVVAFVAGIIISGFIFGVTFYTARFSGGYYFTMPPPIPAHQGISLRAYEEKPLTELEVAGRMVIYTAHLGLEVNDVDMAISEIQRIAEDLGGFVSDVSTSGMDGRRVGSITVRVPQADFDEAILEIEKHGELESKVVRGEDVTEQYIDLTARLNNLQRQEERLLEILALANTVDEVLKVESELNRVRGEIERLTGQIRYLESRVDLATITVSLTEVAVEPWIEFPKVDWGAPIEAGLWGMFQVIQGMITLAIVAAPFVAIGAPAYYLYKRRKGTGSEASPKS